MNYQPLVEQIGKSDAEKGMYDPKPLKLSQGQIIYRFASDSIVQGTAEAGLQYYSNIFPLESGRWWILEEDYNLIVRHAAIKGVDLGAEARKELAIKYEWSLANIIVKATLKNGLTAWQGACKPQLENLPNNRVMYWLGNRSIRQLYIPQFVDGSGMITPLGRDSLFTVARRIESDNSKAKFGKR